MELTIKEAYELCVQKWTALAEYDFSIPMKGHYAELMESVNPKITDCNGFCGYCEFYGSNCLAGCPLVVDGKDCFDAGHPFDYWLQTESKETAQKVLDLIIKTKPKWDDN